MLRPAAQRFSIALGAAAPEPMTRGLGLAQCALLNEEAASRAATILAQVVADSTPTDGAVPSRELRAMVASAAALLLKVGAWADAPVSPVESRFALATALKELQPSSEANREVFDQVAAGVLQLQALLCGAMAPAAPSDGRA